jgi:hypothetical protein
MTAAVPGTLRRDARPPIEMDAAPAPGTAAGRRPTVVPRGWVRAGFLTGSSRGHEPDDPAVRRFWTALMGPGAVADLLRLIAAAHNGRRVRHPLHLGILASEGLLAYRKDKVLVPRRVPFLSDGRLARLRPSLRSEYRLLLEG